MASTTRIGVLGMGRWGRTLIAAFARRGEVVVAANRGAEEALAWLRETHPSIESSRDPDAVIADASLDAVVIATPIATHAELAVAALGAGRHVFVEKPIAMTGTDARRVVAAAERAGRILFTGHTFLFDEGIARLREELDPANITVMRTTWHKHGTFGEPLIWNLLPHELSIAMALHRASPTSCAVLETGSGPTECDRLRLHVAFEASTCEIEIDRTRTERARRVEVETRDGATWRWSDGTLERRQGTRVERLVERTEEPLDREVRAFLGSLADGRVPPGADGSFATAVVEAVERVADQLHRAPLAGTAGAEVRR